MDIVTDSELLAECEVETFCSSGPGGQNVNRRETAVRLRHRPSGLVVTCQRERNQYRNKQIAIATLRVKLHALHRKRIPRIATAMPKSIRERILSQKKHVALKKRFRQKPVLDE